MKLKDRLKAARKHKGEMIGKRYTQSNLADDSGVLQQTISIIENGGGQESPGLLRLATACGVDPVWLESGKGEMFTGEVIQPIKKTIKINPTPSHAAPVLITLV